VSEDVGTEPRTVANVAWAVRSLLLDLILIRLDLIHSELALIRLNLRICEVMKTVTVCDTYDHSFYLLIGRSCLKSWQLLILFMVGSFPA
jgi:hypothetical protein